MNSVLFAVLMPQLEIPLPEESVHLINPQKTTWFLLTTQGGKNIKNDIIKMVAFEGDDDL